MEITNQQIENALYRFLSDQAYTNPEFLKDMVTEILEDQGLLKLMEETDKQENPSVPLSTVYEYLEN